MWKEEREIWGRREQREVEATAKAGTVKPRYSELCQHGEFSPDDNVLSHKNGYNELKHKYTSR